MDPGKVGRATKQASREFGIKFARALRDHAREAAAEHDLDDRYICLGAAEYLRQDAESRLRPQPDQIDPSRTTPEEREN
jgi:hypothetical protein